MTWRRISAPRRNAGRMRSTEMKEALPQAIRAAVQGDAVEQRRHRMLLRAEAKSSGDLQAGPGALAARRRRDADELRQQV